MSDRATFVNAGGGEADFSAAEIEYARYRIQLERNGAMDFESFVAERPALAAELRALHGVGNLSPDFGEDNEASLPEQVAGYRLLSSIPNSRGYLDFVAAPVNGGYSQRLWLFGKVLDRAKVERSTADLMRKLLSRDLPEFVPVHAAGVDDVGRPFFVMDLSVGVEVSQYCDGLRLQVAERVELIACLCDIVQAGHDAQLVHSMLQGCDVLVHDQARKPRLMVHGFGIASVAFDLADSDTSADLRSLGALMSEIVVGLPRIEPLCPRQQPVGPHQTYVPSGSAPPSRRLAESPDILVQAARLRSTTPRSLLRMLRVDLDHVILDACSGRTYTSAGELAADLRRHLAGKPLSCVPSSVPYRFSKFLFRCRRRLRDPRYRPSGRD